MGLDADIARHPEGQNQDALGQIGQAGLARPTVVRVTAFSADRDNAKGSQLG